MSQTSALAGKTGVVTGASSGIGRAIAAALAKAGAHVFLSGRDQAQAPNYQFSVGGRFDFGRGFFLRLEVEGKDEFFFSDRHDTQADSYELVHGRLGYSRDSWSVALWGRNLTDEDYSVRGFGSFGNDPRMGYAVEDYFQLGEPRMVGVDVSVSF